MYEYWRLMRFDKPIGTLLLLWPTLWALWIANRGAPNPLILTVFVLGVILMRAAGCIINDIADRRLDGKVQRTKTRPLVLQTIPIKNALILFFSLCLIAAGLVWLLNPLTIVLAVFALMLTLIYPFMKRFTHWPQAFLGLAFAWGIPMAFAAELNTVPMTAWWLFGATALWIIAYDTQYAMIDRPDDLTIGVKSTAILFGRHDRLIIGLLQAFSLLSLLLLADFLGLNFSFYWGWGCALILAVYQQFLIRHRHPKACFKAFANNHWFGCCLFIGFLLGI